MVISRLFTWEVVLLVLLVLRCHYRRDRIISRRRTRGRDRIWGIRISRDGDSRVVVAVEDVDGGDTYLNCVFAVQCESEDLSAQPTISSQNVRMRSTSNL